MTTIMGTNDGDNVVLFIIKLRQLLQGAIIILLFLPVMITFNA